MLVSCLPCSAKLVDSNSSPEKSLFDGERESGKLWFGGGSLYDLAQSRSIQGKFLPRFDGRVLRVRGWDHIAWCIGVGSTCFLSR